MSAHRRLRTFLTLTGLFGYGCAMAAAYLDPVGASEIWGRDPNAALAAFRDQDTNRLRRVMEPRWGKSGRVEMFPG